MNRFLKTNIPLLTYMSIGLNVVDENKFARKTYPIPLHYQGQVEEEINKMLTNDIIERADSNFLNPMVVVKKK